MPPGVDDAAKVKASFLAAVAHGDVQVALISKARATELLGTMVLALIGLVVAALIGCSPFAPPEIDVAAASIEELDAYIKANCQGDYRTHVRCLNAIDSKRKKK